MSKHVKRDAEPLSRETDYKMENVLLRNRVSNLEKRIFDLQSDNVRLRREIERIMEERS